MDDIYLMTVFVAVAEESSFAGAARRLDFSPATVTRAITHLESKRGVALFERGNKRIALTDSGLRYLEDARLIVKLVHEAEESVLGKNTVPRGILRVTAPLMFGRMYVLPGIADYLKQYPEMEVSTMFVDRNVNLIDEGFDVAIRIGRLPDSSMKGLKIGQISRGIYASPAYLEKYGRPLDPAALVGHKIISTDVSAQSITWKIGSKHNPVSVRMNPVLSVVDGDAAIQAAVLGIGIANLPAYQVAEQVERGGLLPILEEYVNDALPIHILHRESKFSSSRVRSFIDFLSHRLRSEKLFEAKHEQ